MKNPEQDKTQEKRKVPHAKVRIFWIAGWLASAAVLLVLFWPKSGKRLNSTPTTLQPAPSSKKTDARQDRLLGRWVRSDGGYVIEIRHAYDDGKLDAAYFNPNPINVSRAEWQMKDDKLVVVVELRDVNYPGSLYTLEFRDAEVRLVGTYYQAVEGATYDVEFMSEN